MMFVIFKLISAKLFFSIQVQKSLIFIHWCPANHYYRGFCYGLAPESDKHEHTMNRILQNIMYAHNLAQV